MYTHFKCMERSPRRKVAPMHRKHSGAPNSTCQQKMEDVGAGAENKLPAKTFILHRLGKCSSSLFSHRALPVKGITCAVQYIFIRRTSEQETKLFEIFGHWEPLVRWFPLAFLLVNFQYCFLDFYFSKPNVRCLRNHPATEKKVYPVDKTQPTKHPSVSTSASPKIP